MTRAASGSNADDTVEVPKSGRLTDIGVWKGVESNSRQSQWAYAMSSAALVSNGS